MVKSNRGTYMKKKFRRIDNLLLFLKSVKKYKHWRRRWDFLWPLAIFLMIFLNNRNQLQIFNILIAPSNSKYNIMIDLISKVQKIYLILYDNFYQYAILCNICALIHAYLPAFRIQAPICWNMMAHVFFQMHCLHII